MEYNNVLSNSVLILEELTRLNHFLDNIRAECRGVLFSTSPEEVCVAESHTKSGLTAPSPTLPTKKPRRKLAAPKEFQKSDGSVKQYVSDRTCSYFSALVTAHNKYKEVVPPNNRLNWNNFRIIFAHEWAHADQESKVLWTTEPPLWKWEDLENRLDEIKSIKAH